jgi:periplasmic protein TonB
MQNVNRITGLPKQAKIESRFNFLAGIDEEPFLTRLYKVMRASISQTEPHGHSDSVSRLEIESDAYADLAFLKQDAAASFPVRLARELTETIRAIRQDPMVLISLIAKRESTSPEKKRRMKAGVTVAILVYSITLSAIYASYAIFHRRDSSAGDEQHLHITHLQLPPMPVTRTLPVLKQPGGNSKNQLTALAQPPEQHKTEPVKSEPQPHALDQTQTTPEPKTQIASAASEPSPLAEAKASAVLASSGTGGDSGTGNGTGAGSGDGREGVASARVNYNDVFSVSNVTTRPQILGRPTPGYTEEARRAQVEGAVKLSVVLDADGTVSAINVVRGLGHGLDEKAIEAARQLRFVPAQKDGHRVSVRVFLEFKFTLL